MLSRSEIVKKAWITRRQRQGLAIGVGKKGATSKHFAGQNPVTAKRSRITAIKKQLLKRSGIGSAYNQMRGAMDIRGQLHRSVRRSLRSLFEMKRQFSILKNPKKAMSLSNLRQHLTTGSDKYSSSYFAERKTSVAASRYNISRRYKVGSLRGGGRSRRQGGGFSHFGKSHKKL